jgi:hypothetical protein
MGAPDRMLQQSGYVYNFCGASTDKDFECVSLAINLHEKESLIN